jgi:hypothetical protein
MLQIIGGISRIDIDIKRYTKTLDKIMGQIMREAAREWLRAVLTSVNGDFPVWSGAAKSTLVPLGRFLGKVNSYLRVNPKAEARQDRRAEGEQKSEYVLTSSGFDYIFAWSTTLRHFETNEDNEIPFIKSSPWHSLEAGRDAYEAYIKVALRKRLPKIADYIEYTLPTRF